MEPSLPSNFLADQATPVLVAATADLLLKKGWMMATAESCTGGLIAGACTDLAGSSAWFERGFVTYSNAAKTELLGVDATLIDVHGAVSEAVARAMAEGAIAHSRADLAVSVTGYAEHKEEGMAGLVHFGCAMKGRPTRHVLMRYGDIGRAEVRLRALETGLKMLRDAMAGAAEAA